MSETTRRTFIKSTAAGLASAAALSTVRPAHAAANDKLRFALIGCGGRGSGVGSSFAGMQNVEAAYVCDPDSGRAAGAAKKLGGKAISDLREALDDKTVDFVIVATPDHWHAPASILAADAGKHVYVEKPCSHNVREGRLLIEAARRNKRHVQHGTQSRSNQLIARGIQALRDGAIGDVLVAKAWNVQRRGAIGRAEPSAPPAGFDYDMWVGPAPMVPFRKTCHHYTWHWWYNFGTGDTGNDGVHEIDIARWGLDVQTHPSRASAIGGQLSFDDDQQFPDTQYAAFDYPGDGKVGQRRQLIYEMRLWSRYALQGVDNGNAFYGTKGWMLLSKRGILKIFDERNKEVPIKSETPDLKNHFQNFIDAIRDGTQLRAEIEVGHRSATLCHLANICTRLGRSLEFDTESEAVKGDKEANAMLARSYRDGHWAIPEGV